MTRTLASLLAMLAAATLSHARPAWDDVTFDIKGGAANRVRGPGRDYISVRPESGPWTAAFNLGNHTANLENRFINVYSAQTVRFNDYNLSSGHAGQSSYVTFRLCLSEPVTGAGWDLGTTGRSISPGTKFAARYSLDGEDWQEAYVYPAGGTDNFAAPAVPLHFDRPTRVLYIGWHADVPEGETGFWLISTCTAAAAWSGVSVSCSPTRMRPSFRRWTPRISP